MADLVRRDADGDVEDIAPLVSVIVVVYNEERYIEECLRSIAMQQVDFPLEVLVGDDCSPDGTQDVMRRIEPELPDWIHIFYRDHNLGGYGDGNINDLLTRARGKYEIVIEGDDFWSSPTKLAEQVHFMEEHPEYSACYHHCTIVGADSKPNGESYPECKKQEYTWDEYFYCCLPGHLSTALYRREEYMAAKERFIATQSYTTYPGDRRMAYLFLSLGRVHVMQGAWSCYRHITQGGTSYSANVRIDDEYARQEVLFGRSLVEYAKRYGDAACLECSKKFYYRVWLKWCGRLSDPLSRKECMSALRSEKRRLRFLLAPLEWYWVLGTRALRGQAVTI